MPAPTASDKKAAKAFMAFQLRQHDEELWEKFEQLEGSIELVEVPFPEARSFKDMDLKKADRKYLHEKLMSRCAT